MMPLDMIRQETSAERRSAITSLFENAAEETFRRGEPIFSASASQSFPYVYLVSKGMVKLISLRDDKFHLEDYFQRGELINYHAAFNWPAKNQLAESMAHFTAVRRIPAASFREAILGDFSLFEEVSRNLANAQCRIQERLFRVSSLKTHHRIIDFLIRHTLSTGRRVGFEHVVRPSLTHQEIGAIAGVGRQTVTTVLNELRREGIIHFNRHYLIVRDMDKLRLKMPPSPSNTERPPLSR
jgi:CRP/FNR family transcriptional regulator, cyclic AMP receptor protein